MKRIYVAGPYSGPDVITILGNIKRGIETSTQILNKGFAVYCPWLDWQLGITEYIKLEQYRRNSIAWLEVSDAVVLVEGWESSKGTMKEIELAEQLGIPVFEDISLFLNKIKAERGAKTKVENERWRALSHKEQMEELWRVQRINNPTLSPEQGTNS